MALAALVVQSSGQTLKVVVTGKTNGGLSGRDVATIKIDTVGSEDTVDITLVQATPADDDHCTGKKICSSRPWISLCVT